jgi:NTE family protein
MALELAWNRFETILVSDGSRRAAPEPRPARNVVGHLLRTMELIDLQVASLRKRQLLDSFRSGIRKGTYWGAATRIEHYGLPDALPCPAERVAGLAELSSGFRPLKRGVPKRLVNWGYAVCDAALRRHVDPSLARPLGFPFPGGI